MPRFAMTAVFSFVAFAIQPDLLWGQPGSHPVPPFRPPMIPTLQPPPPTFQPPAYRPPMLQPPTLQPAFMKTGITSSLKLIGRSTLAFVVLIGTMADRPF